MHDRGRANKGVRDSLVPRSNSATSKCSVAELGLGTRLGAGVAPIGEMSTSGLVGIAQDKQVFLHLHPPYFETAAPNSHV